MKTKKQITTTILLTFFFMCVFSACSGPDISYVKATQGVLDLESMDTSSTEIVKLDGDWEFYWKKLFNPEDFNRAPDTTSARSGFIDLPGSWLKFKDSNIRTSDYGYATYRLIIEVSGDKEWSMRVPIILTAYKLWVNGRFVASSGKVGTTREESKAGVYAPLIRFNSAGKKIELVLQISNFDDLWGGVNMSFTFGAAEYMQREYEKEFFINTFCFGAILIFALYHFGLFAFRPKDYTTLLFGIFCSFMALCMMVFDTGLAMHFSPSFPWEIAKKIGFLSLNLGSAAFLLFVYFQYPKEVHRNIVLYPSLIFAACASFFIMLAPFRVYVRALFVFDIVLSLTFFYIIYVLITAGIKKREGAAILLAGYTVLTLALANDIMYTFDMIHTGFYIHIGMFVFIFAQGIVIALRNARVASKVEVLSRELGSYSKELEVKVAQRTQQLEEADKQKTNYFVNMAHETKTPLTLILNYLDKDIKKRGTSDEIMLVKQSFDKLKRDMVNLLDLEKLSMGLIFYDHEQTLNVSEALASKLLLFAEIARKKNIRLEKKIAPSVYCKIDHYAFDRIVNNLVDNALRYTKSGGDRVRIPRDGRE
jgi:signal transduction histidine kinase